MSSDDIVDKVKKIIEDETPGEMKRWVWDDETIAQVRKQHELVTDLLNKNGVEYSPHVAFAMMGIGVSVLHEFAFQIDFVKEFIDNAFDSSNKRMES